MKRTETLIKEQLKIEMELNKRNPKEICKAIEKIEKKVGFNSTCLSCIYQGRRDMCIEVNGENMIDTYEEE